MCELLNWDFFDNRLPLFYVSYKLKRAFNSIQLIETNLPNSFNWL